MADLDSCPVLAQQQLSSKHDNQRKVHVSLRNIQLKLGQDVTFMNSCFMKVGNKEKRDIIVSSTNSLKLTKHKEQDEAPIAVYTAYTICYNTKNTLFY